jgi:type VI secretion system protein ImpG
MRGNFDEGLIRRYGAELSYLRRMGMQFARSFPKIAARLELGAEECADPHVERLLESFSFLTARIQHKLDADFPLIPASMLEVLYPSLVQPIPPATIVRFAVGAETPPPPSGVTVPRGAHLTATAETGPACRLRTTSAVKLLPVTVDEVQILPPAAFDAVDSAEVGAVLVIRLSGLGVALSEIGGLDCLRFHITGDPLTARTLYEALNASVREVILDGGDAGRTRLGADAIVPLGFGDDEALLPDPPTAHPGYRLVQEYFAFPDKFMFVEVRGLSQRPPSAELDLLICLDHAPPGTLAVGPENLLLHCTPAINLFPKSAEPIRLDHRTAEYSLVPDVRREAFTEVHSIVEVSLSARDDQPSRRLAPYFSASHSRADDQPVYWIATRRPTGRADLPGTEMTLRFVDPQLRSVRPPAETIYVRTLATNRTLAEQVPGGTQLTPDEPVPARSIVCLRRPTSTAYPDLDGATLWKLVSQLSLNHLSLGSGPESLDALREILTLYCPPQIPGARQQIAGLSGLKTEPAVRRIGRDAWRGFVHGSAVTLEVDLRAFVGGSALLLAAVLARFFALYTSVNSFVEVSVATKQREGIWKTWPPTAGETALI